MSDRVEEYKRLIESILAPEVEGSPKLSEAEDDAAFDKLDALWSSMAEPEREAIAKWREERQS